MKKFKLIDAVQRGTNARRHMDPLLYISDSAEEFLPGDLIDANTVIYLIKKYISELSPGGDILPDSITSDLIKDGTIQMDDLSDDVADKLGSTYDEGEEMLYMNRSHTN